MKCKKRDQDGDVALKVDIGKAYDRVRLTYLDHVILRMGFVQRLVNIAMLCVQTFWYLIAVNKSFDFCPICHESGQHQGDILPPYKFVLCTNGLSSLFSHARVEGQLHGCRFSPVQVLLAYYLQMILCYYIGKVWWNMLRLSIFLYYMSRCRARQSIIKSQVVHLLILVPKLRSKTLRGQFNCHLQNDPVSNKETIFVHGYILKRCYSGLFIVHVSLSTLPPSSLSPRLTPLLFSLDKPELMANKASSAPARPKTSNDLTGGTQRPATIEKRREGRPLSSPLSPPILTPCVGNLEASPAISGGKTTRRSSFSSYLPLRSDLTQWRRAVTTIKLMPWPSEVDAGLRLHPLQRPWAASRSMSSELTLTSPAGRCNPRRAHPTTTVTGIWRSSQCLPPPQHSHYLPFNRKSPRRPAGDISRCR